MFLPDAGKSDSDKSRLFRQTRAVQRSHSWLGLLVGFGTLMAGPAWADDDAQRSAATIIVATHDSSARAKKLADFVGDGHSDQQEINEAIQALPPAGGSVQLMAGTYDIRKVEETLGGVLIDRSHVLLVGQGAATKLVLAANQNTNVVRIIGSGVGHITVRDLHVDANRQQNSAGRGDPKISHDRFEYCGIKAFYTHPGGPRGNRNHNITIENCHVYDAHRLGIMLEGANMRVLNNVLGNAGSDSVEILTGPGEIRGNIVEITGQTHVAIGSDRGDSIIMADNIVRVKAGGKLDIGFRSWAESRRHVIANNVLTVDPEGECTQAMDVRGTGAVVTGNSIHSSHSDRRMRLSVTGGNTVLTGNLLENLVLEIHDTTDEGKLILVGANLLDNATLDHKRGRLRRIATSE